MLIHFHRERFWIIEMVFGLLFVISCSFFLYLVTMIDADHLLDHTTAWNYDAEADFEEESSSGATERLMDKRLQNETPHPPMRFAKYGPNDGLSFLELVSIARPSKKRGKPVPRCLTL